MAHQCENCPGPEGIQNVLDKELEEMDPEEEFYLNQWQTTDRATLITQTVSLEDYKDLLISHMNKLTSHFNIAKCQRQYKKDKKESLDVGECIVLGVHSFHTSKPTFYTRNVNTMVSCKCLKVCKIPLH